MSRCNIKVSAGGSVKAPKVLFEDALQGVLAPNSFGDGAATTLYHKPKQATVKLTSIESLTKI